jgi:hypothetical protein
MGEPGAARSLLERALRIDEASRNDLHPVADTTLARPLIDPVYIP